MYDTLMLLGYILAALAGCGLIASVAVFFGFHIPTLYRELSGDMQKKQIEDIRKKNYSALDQRNKVNVFEELEKKAKVKRSDTSSLNIGTSSRLDQTERQSVSPASNPGTTVLSGAKKADPNFIIEKNIVFVSTTDML